MVARSSTEAEFKAIANTIAEVIWLQRLCHYLNIRLSMTSLFYCDNIGAIYLSSNPMFHACTKHVEIDFHFICNRIVNKSLQVVFISVKD